MLREAKVRLLSWRDANPSVSEGRKATQVRVRESAYISCLSSPIETLPHGVGYS